jgi:uncharacterized protein YabN with tetrapyrrole methylase and pyrophosphatase domain
VEEAYELADAVHAGDDAKVVDELGDVLFQVVFLSLLLEERDAGGLAEVADHCADKLVRRHPHVFGEAEARDATAVLGNWDRIKREEEGRGGDGADALSLESLPATIYARKVQRRVASAEPGSGLGREGALERLTADARRLAAAAQTGRDQAFDVLGELLYSAVAAARELGVDAELALREAANRHARHRGAAGSGR